MTTTTNAFRTAPSNQQWDDAVRNYCLKVKKFTRVAVIGDTTGYGVAASRACAANFKADGAQVVYTANIDQTQPDMLPDLTRARNAGAEVIAVWSVATGMNARLFNARANMGWDVAVAGHPSLASGEIRALIDRPGNWDQVYAVGYLSASYDAAGRVPARSQELIDRLAGKVRLDDTMYWWVAAGFDAVALVAQAVKETGSSQSRDIIAYWNTLADYPGYYGNYTFTPAEHNGYPTREVVMSEAKSARNGTYALAPGY